MSTADDHETSPNGLDLNRSSSVLSQANSQPDVASGDNAEVSDYLDDNDEEREHRYQGPESTWRYLTQDDRATITALDQQRAHDLSIHLFNAHALKARLYDAKSTDKLYYSKQRWIKPNKDGKLPWHPDRHWTAWPLPPDEVPRQEEIFGSAPLDARYDDFTYRKAELWKPSSDLEEMIEASILRKAHEKFSKRQWTAPIDSNPSVAPRTPAEDLAKVESEDSDGEDATPSDVTSKLLGASGVQSHFFNGQCHHPVFLADEEKAHGILKPTVRHIITKVEDLLLGLSKSRRGHATNSRSRSLSRSTKERQTSRKGSAEHVREMSPEVVAEGNIDGEAGNRSESPGPSHTPRHRSAFARNQPGLRDWSEVLGIAALSGWDSAIVDRAARRCASLFGEGMAFRNMIEQAPEFHTDRVLNYHAGPVPKLELEDDESSPGEPQIDALRVTYQCPFLHCKRHDDPYGLARRWREHLKRHHNLEVEQVNDIEASLTSRGGARAEQIQATTLLDDAADTTSSSARSKSDTDHVDDMAGGVHIDGFLRPIQIKLGRGRDVQERRRSIEAREGSKRRRLEHNAETQSDLSP